MARLERAALCDLFLDLGPDQPTLCEGWTTRDLAAHLVTRDRRPDAAVGILIKPLSGYTERIRSATARLPFEDLVAAVRRPPFWTLAAVGPLDRATNTVEFFVHHEDARRGQPDWQPRQLDGPTTRALWHAVRGLARLNLRRFGGRVELAAPGQGEASVGTGDPTVRLTGHPGELVLFLSGRQGAARVELTGPEALTEKLRRAKLGL